MVEVGHHHSHQTMLLNLKKLFDFERFFQYSSIKFNIIIMVLESINLSQPSNNLVGF